jgi:hypothetical protein
MIIVAVKLFSILLNLDKIVLQVAVILTKLSTQYPVHLFIILVLISSKTFMLESKMTM